MLLYLLTLIYCSLLTFKDGIIKCVSLNYYVFFVLSISDSALSPSSSPDTSASASVYVVLGVVCGITLLLVITWTAICVHTGTCDSWFGYADSLSPFGQRSVDLITKPPAAFIVLSVTLPLSTVFVTHSVFIILI